MRRSKAGGGWPAILYTLRKIWAHGPVRMWRALHSKNACKSCALGMGGQHGGMTNEAGQFPEVCKKGVQSTAGDLQPPIEAGFFERHGLEALRRMSPRELEAAGRLAGPLYAGPGSTHYRPIGWPEAMGKLADKLRQTDRDQAFFYASGRASNEAAFLLQLFARAYGTNHVNNCSYYCHQASGVGLSSSIGSGTATIGLEDLHECDLVLLIGANPASNHPRLMRVLMDLKRRGGKILVINPLREAGLVEFKVPSDPRSLLFGTKIADLYLQPNIGGDLAVLSGMSKLLIERGAVDPDFVTSYVEGWPEFRERTLALDWADLLRRGGVPREQLEAAVDLYCRSSRVVFGWCMGVTHHEHGVGNVAQIANLALLRGMVGRPGAGLLPLRGHSNVQGVGSMLVTPSIKPEIAERMEARFGIRLPSMRGLDTLACLERAHEGGMRLALCLGGNLHGASPDTAYSAKAFSNIDLVAYFSTKLNTGHAGGLGRETLILPVLARDEEAQATTQESMFSYLRLSEGGNPHPAGPRAEVELLSELARLTLGTGGPIDWTALAEHRRLREEIGGVVPGYAPISSIDRTRQEFQISGRTLHEPRFATPTGKARLHPVELPLFLELGPGELRLATLRSEGQFNTMVYEDEDVYRGQTRRDVILMNARDIERLGLRVDQPIRVIGPAGSMHGILVREFDLPPGNAAMYYPESNVLIPRSADPRSKTPAFKNVLIRVEADPLHR